MGLLSGVARRLAGVEWGEAAASSSRAEIRRLAAEASVELTPKQALASGLSETLRPGMRVHLPHLPDAPFRTRRDACAAVAAAGGRPVPHAAAREATDPASLERDLRGLLDAGADAVMLVGGGGERKGPFDDAGAALASGAFERAGVRRLALAGHPEGHPAAGTAELSAALRRKLSLAENFAEEVWVVTQFAFEAAPALDWLSKLRTDGVTAPVAVGVAGPTSPRTLMTYALRCGVGPSLRALQSRPSLMARMSRRWRPDEVAEGLAAGLAARPELGPVGLHLFAFGGLEATADWLDETAA